MRVSLLGGVGDVRRSHEREGLLPEEIRRDVVTDDAVLVGPLAVGVHRRAEEMIEEREVGRVVAVDRFGVLGVVPVVEVGSDEHVGERAQAHRHVGVVEDRLEAHDHHVRVDHVLREAQEEDGREDGDARDDELHDRLTRSREPVHVLGAVMHRVEAPEERHLVVGAVRPVLHEVGGEDHEEELGDEGQ